MTRYLMLLLAFAGSTMLAAQQEAPWKRPLSVSLFTMGTQLPGGEFLPLHPGFSLGTEFRINRSEKNFLFQSLVLGAYHHKYAQTALQLYSELGYRRALWSDRLSAEVRLGVGYLHAFPDLEVFRLKDGQYVRKRGLGRPQAMGSFALGVGYKLRSSPEAPRIFAAYQFFVQAPFVRSYVPILPNTAVHVGLAIPFFNR